MPTASAEDRRIAQQQLDEFCKELNVGTHVEKRIPGVEGFEVLSDGTYGNGRDKPVTDSALYGCFVGCVDYLVKGYAYVENHVEEGWKPSAGIRYFHTEPGKYRHAIVPRTPEACAVYDRIIQTSQTLRGYVNDYPELFKDSCIGIEKVSAFQSRYAYQRHFRDKAVQLPGGLIAWPSGSRVIDKVTGEEIAVKLGVAGYDTRVTNQYVAACNQNFALDVAEVLLPLAGE
ncbi:hypothetical protein M2A_2839 [Tepidicaulis marinus]|uniref:Uncharacterized protein n=1 Tax=Tepidicaulis marinus TaxID=1333998 RepID=A0A081BE72_9HYPH|nr:hypothetical protein M2A_2839 [Tepidicaulis marinus]